MGVMKKIGSSKAMRKDTKQRAGQSAGKTPASQTARRTADRAAPDPGEPSQAARIWLVLSLIPPGTVTTYGEVARLAGLPRHARLVGRTLAALPASSRLPWHRVVNAGRKLSPRGDATAVDAQRQRLLAEGVRFQGDRVAVEHLWAH